MPKKKPQKRLNKVKSIEVLGVDYKVEMCRVIKDEEDDCYGITVFTPEKKILLADKLEGDQLFKVFAHEVFHAILHESRVSKLLESNNEEVMCELVEKLAAILLGVYRKI